MSSHPICHLVFSDPVASRVFGAFSQLQFHAASEREVTLLIAPHLSCSTRVTLLSSHILCACVRSGPVGSCPSPHKSRDLSRHASLLFSCLLVSHSSIRSFLLLVRLRLGLVFSCVSRTSPVNTQYNQYCYVTKCYSLHLARRVVIGTYSVLDALFICSALRECSFWTTNMSTLTFSLSL